MSLELLSTLAQIVGGSTILVGAAGWLASKFFENRLNRDIESYKGRLKVEFDAELERLKTELQIVAKEKEIATTWLHQKRANAIETFYISLVDLQRSVQIVLDIFSPRTPSDIRKYTKEAYMKTHEVYASYLKAKIFMTVSTCEKIEAVLRAIQGPIAMYEAFLGNYDDHELHSLSDVKQNAWEDIRDSVPSALSELEAEFRNILGVTSLSNF